jgi:hypothetical protein
MRAGTRARTVRPRAQTETSAFTMGAIFTMRRHHTPTSLAVVMAMVAGALGLGVSPYRHVHPLRPCTAMRCPSMSLAPEPSSRFELLEFSLAVQSDPTEYERLVLVRAGPDSEVIRWHISGPAAQPGLLACEAVVLRPPS